MVIMVSISWNVDLSYDAQITTFTNTYCVDNGTNLKFVLSDSWGDGILGGGYEIYVCQESLTGFVPMTDVSSIVRRVYGSLW